MNSFTLTIFLLYVIGWKNVNVLIAISHISSFNQTNVQYSAEEMEYTLIIYRIYLIVWLFVNIQSASENDREYL